MDQNGFSRLYELDLNGQIWMQTFSKVRFSFANKQKVTADPPPKANSPLTGVAWINATGTVSQYFSKIVILTPHCVLLS